MVDWMLSGSVTSVRMAMASPPAWAISCAVCSPAAALISATFPADTAVTFLASLAASNNAALDNAVAGTILSLVGGGALLWLLGYDVHDRTAIVLTVLLIVATGGYLVLSERQKRK